MNFVTFLTALLMTATLLGKNIEVPQGIYQDVTHSFEYTSDGVLSKTVNFNAVNPLKKLVEKKFGKLFKDRGESHITLLTPVEFKDFRDYFSKDEWRKIDEFKAQHVEFKIECIGVFTKDSETTSFIVVSSPDALKLRQELYDELIKRGGRPQFFDPLNFYPHITLGFTKKDFHIQDGAIKDKTSCPSDWNFN